MAIINYTQAIKCHPDDDEAYFQRAEMYEEVINKTDVLFSHFLSGIKSYQNSLTKIIIIK